MAGECKRRPIAPLLRVDRHSLRRCAAAVGAQRRDPLIRQVDPDEQVDTRKRRHSGIAARAYQSAGCMQSTGLAIPASPGSATSASSLRTTLTVVAVALSIAAAAIHLAAAPMHVEELGPLGWGFVLAAAFQAAWPLTYAVHQTRFVLSLGLAVNVAILGAWAWSRSFGLPVGPLAGMPEPIAIPDLISVIFELLLVALMLARSRRLERWIVTAPRSTPSVAAVGSVVALGMIALTTVLAVSLAMGHEHAFTKLHAEDAAPHAHP